MVTGLGDGVQGRGCSRDIRHAAPHRAAPHRAALHRTAIPDYIKYKKNKCISRIPTPNKIL